MFAAGRSEAKHPRSARAPGDLDQPCFDQPVEDLLDVVSSQRLRRRQARKVCGALRRDRAENSRRVALEDGARIVRPV